MSKESPKKIVVISFRKDGRIHEFYTGNFVLNKGDKVIVEAKEGIELGTVCSKPRLRDASMPDRPIRKVFRLATAEDIEKKKKNERIEAEAMRFCKEQIEKRKMPMNLIAVELSFDIRRLTFFYISTMRVDFRELVKELVQKFNTHVEMKQIGARDLAGKLGGIGHCGRQLCCSLFLSNFDPISIRMAKDQDLSLNPDKISGICGRLMCCLAYEYDTYAERKKTHEEIMGQNSQDLFYITTPIYYVNAEPHIGHAYTTIVADVIARFYRLSGFDTFFLTGTDEHGNKVVEAAEKSGETVKAYVDRISKIFKETWPKINIKNDYFVRTTDKNHQDTVREILSKVYAKGDVYFSEYEGKYCIGCERFYTDTELVQGKCPIHLTEPKIISEENYFFRMSNYQEWLIDYIATHPDFIRPERYRNEVIAFLRGPLEDLCISRPKKRLSWGIPLPFDDNYVTYVWFDALINYISALGYPDGDLFKKFWPVAQHIIAKDILKPHGIFWPCMLKAAGIEPYQHLNVHGYWNVNMGKMSKSLGNIVKPMDLATKYGLDAFRYFLLRDMVFGLDSDFTEESLVKRFNADLANDLGNLVSRSMNMVVKYFDGKLQPSSQFKEEDISLQDASYKVIEEYKDMMKKFTFHKALIVVWVLIGKTNKYIDTMKPWALATQDQERLNTVLNAITEVIKIVSVLLWPFMPHTAEKIQHQLGLGIVGVKLPLNSLEKWGKVKKVRPISKAPPLFPRVNPVKEPKRTHLDVKKVTEQGFKGSKKSDSIFDRVKPEMEEKMREEPGLVSLEDFQRLDIRVGTIKEAETISGSKKLLKLVVDIGERRTIVAGMAAYYQTNELINKQVIVIANLVPVTLMKVESRGMILAVEDEKGVYLLIPDQESKPGSKIS